VLPDDYTVSGPLGAVVTDSAGGYNISIGWLVPTSGSLRVGLPDWDVTADSADPAGTAATHCTGNWNGATADAGWLCIYAHPNARIRFNTAPEVYLVNGATVGKIGAIVKVTPSGGPDEFWGGWAMHTPAPA